MKFKKCGVARLLVWGIFHLVWRHRSDFCVEIYAFDQKSRTVQIDLACEGLGRFYINQKWWRSWYVNAVTNASFSVVFVWLTYSAALATACEKSCSPCAHVWFGRNGLDTSTISTRRGKKADFLPDFTVWIRLFTTFTNTQMPRKKYLFNIISLTFFKPENNFVLLLNKLQKRPQNMIIALTAVWECSNTSAVVDPISF